MDRDPSEIPVQYIKGVGPQRAKLLNRLKIGTAGDSLYYLPYRYEDRKSIKKIRELICGTRETAAGTIVSSEIIHLPRSRYKIFELVISDGTGTLKGKWFNQPYMKKNFAVGREVILSGVVRQNTYRGAGFEMDKPEYEFIDDDTENLIHTSRIVPVYRTTTGLSLRVLRSVIFSVLQTLPGQIVDPIPGEILARNGLPGLQESLVGAHFPPPEADIEDLNRGASDHQRRLAFDELFCLEIGIAVMRKSETRVKGIRFDPQGGLVGRLLEKLAFRLTTAQERVFGEILRDMKQPHPMHRLIQGDVGCGKTIIALMALLTAVECGYQGALMAPTEILAEQHYISMHALVEDLGLRVSLLTGGKKERPLEEIASGEIDLVVGTHALIQEGVRFKRLGFIVIDEQHRFGVMQRAALRKKAGNPDVLVMTATPIPRTLAMTVYGDLDYSVIDELPPNRTPVITRLFHSHEKRLIYETIASEVRKGRQVYVVYPVIEESENSDLKSAILGKTALERIFPDFRTALVHGKMKTGEREAAMASFKKREVDILVSTTVIEVGVDVPNATMMLIVHAERFGLSQLHQLRGRVGRGSQQSHCFLLAYEPCSEEARKRLAIMVRSGDGFRIAEEDLAIRGPGEFFGTKQSGMPDLKTADIIRDVRLLEMARKEAFRLVDDDPELRKSPLLKKTVERFWEGKVALFKTA
ncbi:MAG TPA: ATP-dependent DNA helicase RecG [Thermodesulfovibrionales bacterium]|nr:ATP-dependent DNA helicase RecG [Thermodesulfovibrionales bacterium]